MLKLRSIGVRDYREGNDRKEAPSSEWKASVSARLIRNIDFTPEGVQAKIERVGAQERSCCYNSDTPLEHCPRTTLDSTDHRPPLKDGACSG
jgi:hypothetical protein